MSSNTHLPYVVVVEDDEPIRKLVTLHLKRAGFRVNAFGSAEEALNQLDTVVPQVIVSDITLPAKSGYDLLEAVRAQPHFSETQFIFLSTKNSRQEIRQGMQLGADDYITKPVDANELISAVESRLDRVARLRARVATDLGLPPDIGGYAVIRRLAVGGMSEVFLAQDRTHRTVVLKAVATDIVSNSTHVRRLMREFELVATLRNPHLANFHSCQVTDHKVFLVMEYFPNGDIRQIISTGQASAVAATILTDVLHGLSALHAHGLIHRDVKPGNVMIRKQANPDSPGSYALCDFGLVVLENQPSSLTKTGEVIGTPFYMSPEQLRAKRLTPASDIFSAGVLFYEALTGKRPFVGNNVQDCSHRILTQAMPALPKAYRQYAPLLDAMTAKDVASRLKTAEEALAVLEDLRQT